MAPEERSNPALPPSTGPALQIAALTTVFEKMQDQETRNLKRKLEETTLEMERARMGGEDHRRLCKLNRYAARLEDVREELQDHWHEICEDIALARRFLDIHLRGFSTGATTIQYVRDARRILADAGQVVVEDSSDDEP